MSPIRGPNRKCSQALQTLAGGDLCFKPSLHKTDLPKKKKKYLNEMQAVESESLLLLLLLYYVHNMSKSI